ncbi:hypothetical protein ZWY2020_011804 [Hordeum vulgare]|nr:hypothetical protein ZWY2020_011804 [Hordeum vulgare]
MKTDVLEASPYVQDDCLLIQCDLTVLLKEIPAMAIATKTPEIEVPPSDLLENLAKLLEANKGADVMIKVNRRPSMRIRSCLRCGLRPSMRSSMGQWGKAKSCLQIEDMQPAVFRALLHFIYTDSLPAIYVNDNYDNKEMIKLLLVAADRYAMERMKLMCESILIKILDAKSVLATLAIAEQHHCRKLRDACVEYIKVFS